MLRNKDENMMQASKMCIEDLKNYKLKKGIMFKEEVEKK